MRRSLIAAVSLMLVNSALAELPAPLVTGLALPESVAVTREAELCQHDWRT